jgi:ribosomal protein S18 acetylase RimI-like enzyme
VAYACYGPIEGTAGSFDLYWIAVAPEEQGKGLGPQVFARAEAAMRKAGAKKIYADTSSSDRYAPTRGFYQRMGFIEEARLPDFYGPGDGKVIYVKALASGAAQPRNPGESPAPK